MATDQEVSQIGFRPLVEVDLELIHRWLNAPGETRKWYGLDRDTSMDKIRSDYQPMLDGEEPTRPFIITFAGESIGYIQCYVHRDWPSYWGHLGKPNAAGIDLFIGEPSYLHRGLGAPLIRLFLQEYVFPDQSIESVIIDPSPENAIAIRAYEKAGFRYLTTVSPPEHIETSYLLELIRES